MPIGQPTPKYKFRLLCKRCNSYLHTAIEIEGRALVLTCKACGITASDLDEAHQPETIPDRDLHED
jgi:transcription elongation factor Elf1